MRRDGRLDALHPGLELLVAQLWEKVHADELEPAAAAAAAAAVVVAAAVRFKAKVGKVRDVTSRF